MRWWPFRRRRESAQVRRQRAIAGLPFDLPRRIAAYVADEAGKLGLVVAGEASGDGWVASPGSVMRSHVEWCDAPATEQAAYDTASSMLRKVVREHGPGRVWTAPALAIIYPLYDDGVIVRIDDNDKPVIRLRAHYFHERDARPLTPPPEAA